MSLTVLCTSLAPRSVLPPSFSISHSFWRSCYAIFLHFAIVARFERSSVQRFKSAVDCREERSVLCSTNLFAHNENRRKGTKMKDCRIPETMTQETRTIRLDQTLQMLYNKYSSISKSTSPGNRPSTNLPPPQRMHSQIQSSLPAGRSASHSRTDDRPSSCRNRFRLTEPLSSVRVLHRVRVDRREVQSR